MKSTRYFMLGLSTSKNVELGTYKLEDMAQPSYVQWRDNRSLRGGFVT